MPPRAPGTWMCIVVNSTEAGQTCTHHNWSCSHSSAPELAIASTACLVAQYTAPPPYASCPAMLQQGGTGCAAVCDALRRRRANDGIGRWVNSPGRVPSPSHALPCLPMKMMWPRLRCTMPGVNARSSVTTEVTAGGSGRGSRSQSNVGHYGCLAPSGAGCWVVAPFRAVLQSASLSESTRPAHR